FTSAQIIVLLISPDFLASDASYAEMELALQRHDVGLAYVIPLLLRPVDWKATPIARLQVLPHNEKPVAMWANPDAAFAEIAEEIRLVNEQTSLTEESATPLKEPRNPFKGLQAFGIKDAKDFFCRDRLI